MIIKLIFTIIFKIILYIPIRLIKINNKICLFTSGHKDSYTGNTRYLFEEMNRIENYKCYWVTENIDVYNYVKSEGYDVINYKSKNIKNLMLFLKAKYLFGTHNGVLPVFLIKSSQVVVQTWHGIPLKNMGKFKKNTTFAETLFSKYTLNIANYFLSPSQKYSEVMSKSFGINIDKFKITGYPRNDVLRNPDYDKKEILKDLNIPLKYLQSKIILYVPTFRKEESVDLFPFEDFDSSKIDDFLESQDVIIITRKHYYDGKTNNDSKNLRIFNFPSSNIKVDVQEVLNITDILATDYSGIYFDYLIKNKPIIFINSDIEEYKQEWGFLFDYEKFTPGNKVNSYKLFTEAIVNAIKKPNHYNNQRKDIKNTIIELNDSQSSINKTLKLIGVRK